MKKYSTPKNRAERHKKLKKQSLERPGVKEMMEAYNFWQEGNEAVLAYEATKNSSRVTYSDSSEPRFSNKEEK